VVFPFVWYYKQASQFRLDKEYSLFSEFIHWNIRKLSKSQDFDRLFLWAIINIQALQFSIIFAIPSYNSSIQIFRSWKFGQDISQRKQQLPLLFEQTEKVRWYLCEPTTSVVKIVKTIYRLFNGTMLFKTLRQVATEFWTVEDERVTVS
jgi:hypothetical protein